MELGLTGRVAIVTGAAGGIGAETARMLASEGMSLVIADLNGEKAEQTAAALIAQNYKAIAVQCDVRSESDVQRMAQLCDSTYGRLDVLVNNAGLAKDRTLLKMQEDEWDLVHDVVLKGAFHCCRASIPLMHRNNWGRVINITSRAVYGNPGQTNYSSAKAGLDGFTRALSAEQAHKGITVNSIAPGYIETDYIKSLPNYETIFRNVQEKTQVKFPGQPSDIAGAVAFIASEYARYITGTTLYVTGGRYG